MAENWKCPHCGQYATIQMQDYCEKELTSEKSTLGQDLRHAGTRKKVRVNMTRCPNKNCNELSINATLSRYDDAYYDPWSVTRVYRMYPDADTANLPDYIPESIRQDLSEAQLVKDLSPRASVTLCRRSVQQMIRDRWNIKKWNLKNAIEELEKEDKAPGSIEALNAIRDIGKLGAHPEEDINLIIEVEPEDAELSIALVVNLIEDWYVERHVREQRALKMKETLAKKEEMRAQHKANSDTSE